MDHLLEYISSHLSDNESFPLSPPAEHSRTDTQHDVDPSSREIASRNTAERLILRQEGDDGSRIVLSTCAEALIRKRVEESLAARVNERSSLRANLPLALIAIAGGVIATYGSLKVHCYSVQIALILNAVQLVLAHNARTSQHFENQAQRPQRNCDQCIETCQIVPPVLLNLAFFTFLVLVMPFLIDESNEIALRGIENTVAQYASMVATHMWRK